MKKNKSKSKGKAHAVVKDEVKVNAQEEINCAICRFPIKNNHQMLTCITCKKNAHHGCYNLDLIESSDSFTCDMCKLKKRKPSYCYCWVCQQFDQRQILKICRTLTPPNSPTQNLFVHTQCGILSPYIEVQSYSKLDFLKRKQNDKSYTKSDCCANQKSCPGALVHCVLCTMKGHFRCKIVEIGQAGNNYMIYKWLDKCQKYDFLLHYILKKKSGIKGLVDPPAKLPKDPNGGNMVCQKHSEEYPWCYCDNWQISNNKDQNKPPDYICDSCDRYIHLPCSGLPPNYPKEFTCQGCKQHDIFKRELKLHQLIGQISKIEKNGRLDDGTIRLLNAFPFKYSAILQKRINQNMKQIQMYFIRRQVLKLIDKQQIEKNQKIQKKLLQILLYLNYGQKWKQHQNLQIASNLHQSDILKKLRLSKQQQEKLFSMLNTKVKQKKKSQEYTLLKDTLRKFIKQWKNINFSRSSDGYTALAAVIKDIQIKFLNVFEDPKQDEKKFIQSFSHLLGSEIFGLLISKNYSIELIQVILKKLAKLKLCQAQSKQISEQQYYRLLNQKNIILSAQEQILWDKLIVLVKNELRDLSIVYSSVRKQNTFRQLENTLRDKFNDNCLLANVESQAISKQICTIGHDSAFITMKVYLIQQNVIKKKLLSICNQKDCTLTEKKMRYAPKMQEFLNKKKNILSPVERQSFQSFIGKVQFIYSISRKGQALQQYSIQSKLNGQIQDLQNENRLSIVYQKLFHILDNWDERILSFQFLINQMFHKIVQRKVKFDNKQIMQRLVIFYRIITNRIQRLLSEGQKIACHLLRRLCKILTYLRIKNQYPELFELLQSVRKWLSLFSPEQIPVNISTFLQKPDKVSNLMKVLDTKIISAPDIQRVNIATELNKLCLLRQWCKMTQKINLLNKSKATINAIQLVKGFLDKCCYPQNLLFKKVNQLQIEGKSLNKQVNKFLQKPKIAEHLSFFQELKFISSKMTLQEGHSTKLILQSCNLDVFVQTQQLQNEIKQFELLPNQLGQFAQRKTLPELLSIRKKFIDSCFKINKIQQYDKFLRKIYILKCLNFQPPISRQQYFELLAIGGTAGFQLEKKTQELYRMYKLIQKAELQLSNSNIKKRNFNNLIQWSEQKFKQIKQDLKFDPTQLGKIEKARLTNNKTREEYLNFRNKKIDIQKLKQLELELSSSIFNNKDIILQISNIKNEAFVIARRIQQMISYHATNPALHSHDNVFKIQRRVHENYGNIRVIHPTIERFENDCRNYFKADQLRQSGLNWQNYRLYCETCSRISDPGCKIPQFLNSRVVQYYQMFKSVIQAEQPSIGMLQVLITQGLQIRRLQSPSKEKVFNMVFQLYEKLHKITNTNIHEQSDNMSERLDDEEIDDQQLQSQQEGEQDQEDLDDMQDQMDQDSDDIDSEGDQDGKDNQIVLDSD